MSCLAWSCLVAAAATAATAAGSAGPAAAVAAAYLPTTGPSCVRHKGHTQRSSLAGRSVANPRLAGHEGRAMR